MKTEKMLKRFGVILLSLLLTLSVIGCGKPVSEPTPAPTPEVTAEEMSNESEETAGETEESADIAEESSPEAEEESTEETADVEESVETEEETPYETITETEEESTEEETETEAEETTEEVTEAEAVLLDPDGYYNTKDEVALYIHTYGKLPQNYLSKKEAEKLGWSGGGLDPYADGKSIGGSRFGNYEGILPEKNGRSYTECDIDTAHKKKRGAKRIVFSNDGLIFYTEDHYETFVLLYDENGPAAEEIIYGGEN